MKLAQVHDYVALENPSASLGQVQHRTLELIRSMAHDGLIALGELKDHGARFVPWDVSVDDGIRRLAADYVDRFDDPAGWPWTLWLAVTDEGKRVARTFESQYGAWLEDLRAKGLEYEAIPPQLTPGGAHDL